MNRIIDLVATDAVFAWAAMLKHVGYVGICFTKQHEQLILNHLISKLKVAMADAASPLYNPSYALAVGKTETPQPPKTTKAAKRKRAVGKPKTAPKKAKKKADDDVAPTEEDVSEDFFGDEDDEDENEDDENEDDTWDPLK